MENVAENQTGPALGIQANERAQSQERITHKQADIALRERVHALLQFNQLDSKQNVDRAFAECKDIRDQLVNKLVKEKVTSQNKGFLGAIKSKLQEFAVQVGFYRGEKEAQLHKINEDNLITNQEMSLVIGNALKVENIFEYKDGIRTRADLFGGDVRYEALKNVNAATIKKYNDNLGLIDRYVPADHRRIGRVLGVAAFTGASILARREIYQGLSALAGDVTMMSGAAVGATVGGVSGYALSKLKGSAYYTENYLRKLEEKVDLGVFSGNSTETKLRDLLNKAETVRNGGAVDQNYDSRLVNAYNVIDNMLGDWTLKGDNVMKAKMTALYADMKAYIIKHDVDVNALTQANLASELKACIDKQYNRDAKIAGAMGIGFGALGGGLFGYLNEHHSLMGHAHAAENNVNNTVIATDNQTNHGFYRPFDADFDQTAPHGGFGGHGNIYGMGKLDPNDPFYQKMTNGNSSLFPKSNNWFNQPSSNWPNSNYHFTVPQAHSTGNDLTADAVQNAADNAKNAGNSIIDTAKDMMDNSKDAVQDTSQDIVNNITTPEHHVDWTELPVKVDQRIMDAIGDDVSKFENLKLAVQQDLAKGMDHDYLIGDDDIARIVHLEHIYTDNWVFGYAERAGISVEEMNSILKEFPSLKTQGATGLEPRQIADLIKLAAEGDKGAKVANVISDVNDIRLGRFAELIDHYKHGNVSDAKLYEVTVNVLNSDKDIPSDVIVNIENNPNINIENSLDGINNYVKTGDTNIIDNFPEPPIHGPDDVVPTPGHDDIPPVPTPPGPDGKIASDIEDVVRRTRDEVVVDPGQSKESWWGWLWNFDKPIPDNAPLTNYVNYNEVVNTGLKAGGVYLAGRYIALPVLRGLWNAGAWVRNRLNRSTSPAGPAPTPPAVVPGGPAPAPAAPAVPVAGGPAPAPAAPVGSAAPVPPVVPPAGPAPTPPPPGGAAPTPPPVPAGPAPTPPPVTPPAGPAPTPPPPGGAAPTPPPVTP